MKKYVQIMLSILCVFILVGCGKTQKTENNIQEDTAKIQEAESSLLEETTEIEKSETFDFKELKNWNFSFLSGAGGWSTDLTIEEDGTFMGVYHDSDMGDSSDEYPYGTMYFCSFYGKFTQPVQKDEYIYSTTIESIFYDNLVGTEEILDGIRYIYSDAYGLDNAEEILIYLPQMPIADLPEGYISWVNMKWLMDDEVKEKNLSFYGLYNVTEEEGFSSYNCLDALEESLVYREEEAAALEDIMANDPNLTQTDYNEYSLRIFQIWDRALNDIWSILKYNLDSDDMSALTEEQLEWIVMKEASMKEAGAEVEGGSMYGLVVNQRGAQLTKERVYELMEIVRTIK